MTAKGSSSASCCCTSCETMPFTNPAEAELPQPYDPGQLISFKGHPIDYVQGFCCTCLPSYACVSVECVATGELTNAYIPVKCNSVEVNENGLAEVYTGNIYLNGEAHLAYLTLNVAEDLKCYFCLEIPSISFAKQCLELTADHMVPPLMWCKTLTYEIVDGVRIPSTFTGTAYACGDIIIKVNVPSVQAITGRPKQLRDLYGTIGPYYEAGRLYFDENSLANRCKGCGCISSRACISIYRVKSGTSESYPMNLGCDRCVECPTGHIYSTILGDYGPLVSIEKDPSCEPGDPSCSCFLRLLQIDNLNQFESAYSAAAIEKGTDPGDCPFPLERWTIDAGDGDVTIVDFRTESCVSEPCSINPGGCCVGVEMPNVIHVTIERVADYASTSCECLPQTIPMLFDGSSINPSWTGRYSTSGGAGSWCIGAEHDFKVRLFCGGNNWSFQWGAGEGYIASPCAGSVMSSPADFSCRPVYFRFETDGACCGPSGFPDGMGGFTPAGPSTLVFTITE